MVGKVVLPNFNSWCSGGLTTLAVAYYNSFSDSAIVDMYRNIAVSSVLTKAPADCVLLPQTVPPRIQSAS